jgi:hypothetical protein
MISDKICKSFAGSVLLLTSGCQVAPDSPPLALKFSPHQQTTYRVATEAQRSMKWEGDLPDSSAFQGGKTVSRITIVYSRKVLSTDDNGNAAAEVTLDSLKCFRTVKGETELNFDSSRVENQDSPLAKLTGQRYIIKITPAGEITEVTDYEPAQAAVKGETRIHKLASSLVSPDTIKQRHGTVTLPEIDNKKSGKGISWSNIKSFSFGMMGPKSFERVYKVDKVEKCGDEQIAVVKMEGVPTTKTAQKLHKEQSTSLIPEMFDNAATYTGKLELNLNTGTIKRYLEKLESEWVAVDPAPKSDKEPATLRMKVVRLYSLEAVQ